MEILEQGTPPGERIYIATCSTCKTKVRFKKQEARVESDFRNGSYLAVRCPTAGCGQDITTDTKNYEK